MILVNFGHPITEVQREQVERLTGRPLDRVFDLTVQFDHRRPFAPQVAALIESAGLKGIDWQTAPLLVNLPSFSPIAAVLLAELHGLMGYFPTVLRLRPTPDAVPPTYEVAELLPLQALRDESRRSR